MQVLTQSIHPPAICIMGPTASGKSDLAIALADQLPLEIINVDSAQVYRGLNIGASKPCTQTLAKVPHHLIDFLDPAIPYSAAQFCEEALVCMQAIYQRERIPVLVGGTMLYFKALQEGLSALPQADAALRKQLDLLIEEQGLENAFLKLQAVDAISAQRIKPTDRQRIQRALEIYEATGKPMSYWLSQPKNNRACAYQFINIGLIPMETPREILHERIAQRFRGMLAQGFIEEVQQLMQRADLTAELPALRAVGYRQIREYLLGECTAAQMEEKAIAATRQLAKRQLTWLRPWPGLIAFDFKDSKLLEKVLGHLQPLIEKEI